jgi:type IV secretory pathway VirB2 component (pilin)
MKQIKKQIDIFLYLIYKNYLCLIYRYGNACLFVLGIFFLTCGIIQLSYADGGDSSEAEKIIKEQLCKIMNLLAGPFGALVMVVAGLAAVVTAAMGAYKMAMSCLVIALGSYLVEAFAKLFFGDEIFSGGSGGCVLKTNKPA